MVLVSVFWVMAHESGYNLSMVYIANVNIIGVGSVFWNWTFWKSGIFKKCSIKLGFFLKVEYLVKVVKKCFFLKVECSATIYKSCCLSCKLLKMIIYIRGFISFLNQLLSNT